jgi:hypothetical protein
MTGNEWGLVLSVGLGAIGILLCLYALWILHNN